MTTETKQDESGKLAWTAPVLENLGDVANVMANPGSGADGGTPGDNHS
jgi:hypothetical protein